MSIPALVLALLSVSFLLLTVKLSLTGLVRRYRAFSAYLLFRLIHTAVTLSLGTTSKLYFKFWVVTLPIAWVLWVLTVRELCGLVLENYQGLKTAGRWAMYLGTAVSVGISILAALPRIRPAQRSQILVYLAPMDRGISLSLAIFLLLMMFLLSTYPVKLNRNILVHAALFTVFFLANTLSNLLHTLFGLKIPLALDMGLLAASGACAVAWLFLLTSKGEEVQRSVIQFSAAQEERILYKLEALNTTLLKASHK